MLRGVTPVMQSDYSSLQSTYSSPDRVIVGGRAVGEANADGDRDSPREVGASLDIRVDSRAEHGDGDAHSPGVESVAATVARRCTQRKPMFMANIAATTVTSEPVSGGTARGSDTHSTVAVGGGADVPDIPEVISEQSGAAMLRQYARHALVGVEVGGSDGGHGHVDIQAFGHDG